MTPLGSPFSEALDVRTAYARAIVGIATRGTTSASLVPSSGTITQDVRRAMRWDASLTLAANVNNVPIPTIPEDLLTPFGTRVELRLGVELADGSSAQVGYGHYMIESEEVTISGAERLITIGLVDLATRVADYRFESPFTIPSGTDIADAVNLVIVDRLGEDPALPDTGVTTGRDNVLGLEAEADPWRELSDLVASFGYRIYYDRNGVLRLDQQPMHDATFAQPLGGELTVTGAFDHHPANVVVARGEASNDTPPVQGVAMDLDPSSPTYAGVTPGSTPYGRVTRFFASPLLVTQAQADAAAESVLASEVVPAAWDVAKAYDPEVDVDDVFTIPITPTVTLPLVAHAVTVEVAGQTTIVTQGITALS